MPANQVVDIVDVCQTPSHMGLRRFVTPGPAGAGPRTRRELFVVCFLSNQVMVVDPDVPVVTQSILVGGGPNDIAFNFGNDDAEPPPLHRRAYVTNFSDSSISVIDLDPGSPTELRAIGRLGIPTALK
jgi:DNA-binding beta-propeller fold protein YncE